MVKCVACYDDPVLVLNSDRTVHSQLGCETVSSWFSVNVLSWSGSCMRHYGLAATSAWANKLGTENSCRA